MKLDTTILPSNKKFGTFFTLLFFAASCFMIYQTILDVAVLFACVSAVFGLITMLNASMLTPLNKFWMMLGLFLGRIISPLIVSFIFFFLITPVSMVSRIIGRDPLCISQKKSKSYWIDRANKKIDPKSFSDQF